MKDDKYMDFLGFYVRSVFQAFENCLRTEVDLVEDDIKLVLGEYNSRFFTYEIEQGIYTTKDISEALLKILQPEHDRYYNAIDIEFDDIEMKTKLDVRAGNIAIRNDEQSFFSTFLAFTPHWVFKHSNKDISQEIKYLNATNKIHLKSDSIDGNVVNGLRHSIFNSSVLDKLPGYTVFCQHETIHYRKKTNISVLNTITFYLEDDNNKETNFNGETLVFTLQMFQC